MMRIRSIRKITGNAISLLASNVVNRATTFVLYTMVARYVGAPGFGRLSVALTLFYVFQVFAVAGLKTLVVREVAQDRTTTDRYLVNGSVLVCITSLVSIGILLVFVRSMRYPAQTASVIVLLSLALLPYSLAAICEAIFQAWEQMHYIAYANITVNIAKIALAYVVLSQGYGLYYVVMLLLLSQVASVVVLWWLVLRHVARLRPDIDPPFMLAISKAAGTFLGIDGLIAVAASLNIILLSKLAGETEVGLYSAASQLLVPVALVSNSIVFSLFPLMCKQVDPSLQGLKRISEYLIALLMSIVLPATLGLFFLASSALSFIYGDKSYLLASATLRIGVWNLVLSALTGVFGHVLFASLRENVTLRIVAADTLVTLVLGLVLINRFGVIGAAITALFTGIVDFVLHYVPVSKLISKIAWWRSVWKPTVATLCMAIYLAAVHIDHLLLAVVSAGALYGGVLLALTVWSMGGLRQLKAKYLYLRSDVHS